MSKKLVLLLVAAAVLIVVSLSADAWADPQVRPIRNYDTDCDYQHSAQDDPLMWPGQPGASEMHDFFGNESTNAFSTGESLLVAHRQDAQNPPAGCADIGDGAAYWAPTIYKPDGTPKVPDGIHAYYRAYQKFEDYPIVEYPVGFAMISHRYKYACRVDRSDKYDTIPSDCSHGFVGIVEFPDCWDGVTLFDPEGDHVKFRYPQGGNPQNPVCPDSHPVRISELTLVVKYNGDCYVPGYLTSCYLSTGAQTTYHADFFNAWEPNDEPGDGGQTSPYDKQEILIRECLNIATQEPFWCKEDEHEWPRP